MERSQDQSKLNLEYHRVPLMLLLYINDIRENIGSSVRLFADDSLVYMAVSSRNECQRLQDDLTTMVNWSKKWQMIFNPSKCYTLRITKGKQPGIYPYHMEGPVLESVNNNPYLGVELSSTLSWDTHIDKIPTKASGICSSFSQLEPHLSRYQSTQARTN